MLQRVQQTVLQRALLDGASTIVAAVSGGADSVAMLHALHDLRSRGLFTLPIIVAHVNHGLRGRESDSDERFVQETAWRLGLACISHHVNVRQLARDARVSIEMAARDARRSLFRELSQSIDGAGVANGHTMDDQAETVLLRICRGTSLQGLGGMDYGSASSGFRVIRPLLDVHHGEAVRFLARHRLGWREDASNKDDVYQRNRIRLEVLPLLRERINPSITASLVRLAALCREDHALLRAETARWLKKVAAGDELDMNALKRLDVAVLRHVIHLWLSLRLPDAAAIDSDMVQRVVRLVGSEAAQVDLSQGHRAVRSGQRLSISRARNPVVRKNARFTVKVEVTSGYEAFRGQRIGQLPVVGFLNRNKVGRSSIKVRTWRHGDAMKPQGLRGTKKLQDIFTDRKVPPELRTSVPVVTCRGKIVWLPGYAVDAGWIVPTPESPSLRITIDSAKAP